MPTHRNAALIFPVLPSVSTRGRPCGKYIAEGGVASVMGVAYSGILWHTLAYSGILWHTLAVWHTPAYSTHTLALNAFKAQLLTLCCGCFCVLVSYQPIYLVQKAHSYYLMRRDRSISLLKRGMSSSAWYEDTLGICPSPSPLCLDGPHRTTHPPTQAKSKALQRALAF